MTGYRKYFTDTVTVYHRGVEGRSDTFERVVAPGVMYRRRAVRGVDASGIARLGESVSVTFLPESDPGEKLRVGDLIVQGAGPELGGSCTLRDLKRGHPDLCEVRSLADNRNKPWLRHRRAVCE